VKRDTMLHLVRFLMRTLTRSEFIGLENLPASGGVIVAINHMSHLDTPLLGVNPRRSDITALVTTKYQKHASIKWVINTIEGIWIDRDIADFSAIRKAAKALQSGLALGIAPEGTRSKDYQMHQGKPGIVLLALKTGVPIVPVGISGTEDAIHKLKRLRRPHMVARFGKAFILPPIDRKNRKEKVREYIDEIMCRIAALLPEKYWGYYKNYPRVKNLIMKKPI